MHVLDGDPATFSEQVQPIVARACAFEGCHGREGLPLTLYAVDYLRLRDPNGEVDFSATPLDERALSTAEMEHNRTAFAARVSPDDPRGERLVRRLLPPSTGGIPHAGVVVYPSEDDADVRALRRFMATVRAR